MYVAAHTASRSYGGSEIWISRLLGGLQRRGHRALLYCRTSHIAGWAAQEGIETRVQRLGGDVAFWDAVAMARALRAERPDVFLLTNFRKILLGGMAARMARVPRVVVRLGLGEPVAHRFKYAYPIRHWIDAVVLNNEALCAPFAKGLPVESRQRVLAIWDGVSAPAVARTPGTLRDELGLPANSFVMGAVGRLTGQKRFDRFVEVLARLPERVHGVIAGEGDGRQAIERLARARGVTERLHLLGFRPDVGDVLTGMDVFVLTSDYEGLANAMLEAMALGVPVVSTPVDGARETLFSPAQGGSPPGRVTSWDVADIADAVRELVDQPALRAEMSNAARRRVGEWFSFERMLDEWEAFLAEGRRPDSHKFGLTAL